MVEIRFFIATLQLSLLLALVYGLEDLTPSANNKPSPSDIHFALKYLVQYGYLSEKWLKNKMSTPELMVPSNQEPVKFALSKFQRMAKVLATGEIDAATLEAMRRPRCTASDANLRNATELNNNNNNNRSSANYVLFRTKWHTYNLTYQVTRYTVDLSTDVTDGIVDKMIGQWQAASRLTYKKVTSSPLIEIKWASGNHGDDQPFPGPGAVLGHTYFPPEEPDDGYGLQGDTHFNDDNSWGTERDYGKISLPHVLLHELGHGIGLDHSTNDSAVMYAFFTQSTATRQPILTKDDIDGVQALYGPPASSSPSSPSPSGAGSNRVIKRSTTARVVPTSSSSSRRSTTTTPDGFDIATETTATTTEPPSMKTNNNSNPLCPYTTNHSIRAIAQFNVPDSNYATIAGKIYRLLDIGGNYPGYPKEVADVFPNGPPGATITAIVAFQAPTMGSRQTLLYIFQNDRYWRYDIKKSKSSNGTDLNFAMQAHYPKKVSEGFRGVGNGSVIFQLPGDEAIYFINATHYWAYLTSRPGEVKALPLSHHQVLSYLPARPPLLQSAMLNKDGRSYFFASNGSYWVWSSTKVAANNLDTLAIVVNNNSTDGDSSALLTTSLSPEQQLEAAGRWSTALSIEDWWFSCGDENLSLP